MRSFILPLLLAVLFGCTQSVERKSLDRAIALFDTMPDSTLRILQSIDTSALISKRQKARFTLYYSASLDKNYIDVYSDSLMDKVVEYYSGHSNSHEYMMALYYMGRIQMNKKAFPSAIIFFEKALQIAEKKRDSHYLGLIYRNMADAFGQVNNLSASVDYFQKSLDCFLEKPSDIVYQQYALYSLAAANVSTREYDNARRLLQRIVIGDSNLLDYCRMLNAEIALFDQDDYSTCISLYNKVPEEKYSHVDYTNLALAHERAGRRDSAEYWIERGYKLYPGVLSSAMIDYTKSRIIRGREQYNKAYDLLKNASEVQDSLTRKLLSESVSCAQRDFFKDDAANQRYRIVQMQIRNLSIGIIVYLILSLLFIIYHYKQKNRDLYIKELMAQLALNNKQINKLSKDNADLLNTHYSERIRQLDSISTNYYNVDTEERKNIVFRQFKDYIGELNKGDALYKSIERDLNLYSNNIMVKLRDQVPKIHGRNIKLLILFFAGFSYETVALITGAQSRSSLRTCRSRLRKAIIESKAPDADLFLEML
ncbi:MAG: tetratricopeptide repeat protein [Bacteroidales bacterium]|nr:tetratricopeptide repeat protein [Bacteroidales bacterium]